MSEADETVADVLTDMVQQGHNECVPLLKAATEDYTPAEYEDWVRPLKLTGGRVCLEIDDRTLTSTLYVRRRGDGRLEAQNDHNGGPWWPDPATMMIMLRHDDTTVRPVLVEDTPFAEAEDE